MIYTTRYVCKYDPYMDPFFNGRHISVMHRLLSCIANTLSQIFVAKLRVWNRPPPFLTLVPTRKESH